MHLGPLTTAGKEKVRSPSGQPLGQRAGRPSAPGGPAGRPGLAISKTTATPLPTTVGDFARLPYPGLENHVGAREERWQRMRWGRLGTQKGPRTSGGQRPRERNGGRGYKVGEERGLPGSGIAVVGWGLREAEEPAKAKGVGQGLCESRGRG